MFCILKKEKRILSMFQVVAKEVRSREEEVILLMIPNEEGWFYLEIRKISELKREVISKSNGDFYWLNCLHSFTKRNK